MNNLVALRKIARITLVIWIIFTSVFIASLTAKAIDLQVKHFEDGSGRITYCLPGAICQ